MAGNAPPYPTGPPMNPQTMYNNTPHTQVHQDNSSQMQNYQMNAPPNPSTATPYPSNGPPMQSHAPLAMQNSAPYSSLSQQYPQNAPPRSSSQYAPNAPPPHGGQYAPNAPPPHGSQYAPYAPPTHGGQYASNAPLPPGANQRLASKVEIRVSCNNLINKDVMSKSDPLVVLFTEMKDQKTGQKHWREVSRTEVIQDSLNPKFVTPFAMDYRFEEYQKIKFEVYDSDSDSHKLQNHDFLGRYETTLGSLVGECGGHCTKQLHGIGPTKAGTITINVEEVSAKKESLNFHIIGRHLDKKDFFGSSDPFLVFYRCVIEDNSFVSVHRTEVIKNNLNPKWKPFNISSNTLCNGDDHRTIKVECYDWDSDGGHDLIGEFRTTLNELKSSNTASFALINPKKKSKKKNYKNSGMIDFVRVEAHIEFSFLDFIYGGTELCFHVAVDFTASNGNPSDSRSLHYRSPNGPNMYAQALFAVGSILADYDRDKIIPAYGFGAKLNGTVYHDFNLNQTFDPNCVGLEGVMDAYYRSLGVAELYGPTIFSQIISKVSQEASSSMGGGKYHILLILTDGIISDMESTKRAIVAASKYPLSIIIVGVGNADFEAMDELDSDDRLLKANGVVAQRDIVQFVPYRNFLHTSDSGARLAGEVLYEVPNQLTSFMKAWKVKPGNTR